MRRHGAFIRVAAVFFAVVCCGMHTVSAAYTTKYADVSYTPTDYYVKWYFGCTATAAGSLMAYWDAHGYSNLIQGSTANDLADNIASLSHLQTWYTSTAADITNRYTTRNSSTAGAMSDPAASVAYVNNSLADFMGSSRGSYGSSVWQGGFTANADTEIKWTEDGKANLTQGLMDFATYRGYSSYADFIPYSANLWTTLRAEIDAGRPVLLYVDSNGGADGLDQANHTVPVYGYRYDGAVIQFYFYSLLDNVPTGYWADFKKTGVGATSAAKQWGITGMEVFDPTRSAPVHLPSAPVSIASGQTVSANGNNLAAVKGTAARVSDFATSYALQLREYYLDYTTVTALHGSTVTAVGSYTPAFAIGNGNEVSLGGAVSASGASAAAVYLSGENNTVTVETTGVLSALAVANTYGIWADGYRNTIDVKGAITTNNTNGYAVILNAFEGMYTRAGSSISTSGSSGHGIYAQIQNTIDVAGSVAVTGASSNAAYLGTGNVLNVRGTLSATQATSYAIYSSATSGQLKNVVNVMSGASFVGDLWNAGAAGNAEINFGGEKDVAGNVVTLDRGMVFSTASKIRNARWVANVLAGETYLNGTTNTISALTVNEGATLGGSGIVSVSAGMTNYGILSPGQYGSIGTLMLTATLTQKSSGQIVLDLSPAGTKDVLSVIGTMTCEGGIVKVRGLNTAMPFSHTYAGVITAAVALNGYENLTFFSTPLVTVTPSKVGSAVNLDVTVHSLASVASTVQQTSVATAFDSLRASGGDAATVISTLADLPTTREVTQAFDAMTGRSTVSLPQLTQQSSSAAVQAISGRMDMMRQGSVSQTGGLAFGNLRNSGAGYFFDSPTKFFLGVDAAQGYGKTAPLGGGLWAKADEVWGDAETTVDRTGYRQRGSLTTIGSDVRFGEVTAGGSYGFGDGYAEFADDARTDIDGKHYSGYLGWDDRCTYVYSVLTFSRFGNQTYRPVRFAGIDRLATADFHARRYTAYTELGHRIEVTARHEFTPLLGLVYSRYRQNAYRESGADSLDLSVDGEELASLEPSVGASYRYRMHQSKSYEDSVVLRTRYSRELLAHDSSATVSFSQNTAQSFSISGPKDDRNVYLAGAGYDVRLADRVTLSGAFDAVFRRDYRGQRASAQVRWDF